MTRRGIALALAILVAAACTRGEGSETITVLAAASLTEVFAALATEFEASHPGTTVELGFGASSDLATQIEEGAPADVFASADEETMQRVVDADGADDPVVFARNQLAIAVERGNPLGIETLADVDDPGVIVVLCAEQVPCGKLADQALVNADVSLTPASRAASVKAALATVELGEADAAIVYATDVESSDDVEGIEIPDDVNVVSRLPVATLRETNDRTGARAFVDFVTSPAGQRVLERFGFLAP